MGGSGGSEWILNEVVERADRDRLTGRFNHRAFYKGLEEETLREGVNPYLTGSRRGQIPHAKALPKMSPSVSVTCTPKSAAIQPRAAPRRAARKPQRNFIALNFEADP